MKTKPFILALTVSVLALAPLLRAQQPSPSPTPEQDVFDALKRGITKVQKQAREARELEPEVKALQHRQDAMEQGLTEDKKHLRDVLVHQEREIERLVVAVERLDSELKALRAAAPPATAAPTPASTPTQP